MNVNTIIEELRAIRAEQTEQGKLLARVDERTDALLRSHEDLDSDHEKLHARVNGLEATKRRLMAYVAALGAVATAVGGALSDAVANAASGLFR